MALCPTNPTTDVARPGSAAVMCPILYTRANNSHSQYRSCKTVLQDPACTCRHKQRHVAQPQHHMWTWPHHTHSSATCNNSSTVADCNNLHQQGGRYAGSQPDGQATAMPAQTLLTTEMLSKTRWDSKAVYHARTTHIDHADRRCNTTPPFTTTQYHLGQLPHAKFTLCNRSNPPFGILASACWAQTV